MIHVKPDKLFPGQPDQCAMRFAAIESARQIRQQMWEAAQVARMEMASQRMAFRDYLKS